MKRTSLSLLLAVALTLQLTAVVSIVFSGCTTSPETESSVVVSAVQSVPESQPESSEVSIEESKPEYDIDDIDELETKYFVKKLPKKLQKCFAVLYGCAKDHNDKVTFPECVTDDELLTLMFLLNYDCPELIHVSGDYHPEYSGKKQTPIEGVGLFFTMDENKQKEANEQLDEYIETMRTHTKDMSEPEIEKYVYDSIFYGCTYNEGHEYAGSVYGALICGQARCEGLCKSFMWCMRKLGIECMCVSGPQNWNSNAMYSDHSWDIVRINGEYYHLDLTLDDVRTSDEIKTEPNYGFYNVDDDTILQNHSINTVFSEIGVPKCDSTDYNYHVMNNLLIRKGENLRQRLNEILGQHFRESGIDPVSIKCEDENDYITLGSESNIWIREFLAEYSTADFKINTYTTELSRTLLIQAEMK